MLFTAFVYVVQVVVAGEIPIIFIAGKQQTRPTVKPVRPLTTAYPRLSDVDFTVEVSGARGKLSGQV